MELLFAGVDMGTSSVKALITDRQGRRIAGASEAYMPVSPHPDWIEMDPECWYTAAVRGIRRMLAKAEPAWVSGLCCTGQMHNLTLAVLEGVCYGIGELLSRTYQPLWERGNASGNGRRLPQRYLDAGAC
ncbi:MAG TPA: FGGY family carbohydrate kinase [Candidatus Limiplasma sp.]|nr:FGGY family carbohydrate kinase [Candidatus Limiplasma sp.]HPR77914.1 FGGY family carbohydrate kinase [Candidatus Limiplasma sp.]